MSESAAAYRTGIWSRVAAVRGPAAIIVGAISFSVMAIAVRFLTRAGIPAGELVMIRFSMGLAMLEALRIAGVINISHRRWRALWGRGITGALAILFYFLSIQYTTLTKATLLSNAYPVFAALMAVLALEEKIQWPTAISFALSGLGMWMVARPGPGWAVGDGYGILGALTAGMAIVFIRHLRRTENPFSIFWYLCAFGSALGALTCVRNFVVPSGDLFVLILVMGITSTLGQLLITYGFGYIRAGEGSLISMSTVAYSGLFAWFFLGERLPVPGMIGAGLILACAAYLTLRPQSAADDFIPRG